LNHAANAADNHTDNRPEDRFARFDEYGTCDAHECHQPAQEADCEDNHDDCVTGMKDVAEHDSLLDFDSNAQHLKQAAWPTDREQDSSERMEIAQIRRD
jgi:hypothetical protein